MAVDPGSIAGIAVDTFLDEPLSRGLNGETAVDRFLFPTCLPCRSARRPRAAMEAPGVWRCLEDVVQGMEALLDETEKPPAVPPPTPAAPVQTSDTSACSDRKGSVCVSGSGKGFNPASPADQKN